MSNKPTDPAVGPATNADEILTEPERKLYVASRRAAWLTLGGALLVAGSLIYSFFVLRQIEARKEQLEIEVHDATAQVKHLNDQETALRSQLAQSQQTLDDNSRALKAIKNQLSQARCALRSSRYAIQAFHQRNYEAAITLYDEALECDPDNAYLLNLKAYSEFKLGRLKNAIRTQRQSIKANPNYAWGYFDLARFLCKSGLAAKAEAKENISEAIRLRPGLKAIMQRDGEFRRLCGGLIPN